MHFTLTNQPRLIGFAARSSPVGEERAPVVFREFVTSEDGERLIQRLDAVSDAFLAKDPTGARILESQVDHLIALLHLDGRVEVWVNEPGFRAKMEDHAHGPPVDPSARVGAHEKARRSEPTDQPAAATLRTPSKTGVAPIRRWRNPSN